MVRIAIFHTLRMRLKPAFELFLGRYVKVGKVVVVVAAYQYLLGIIIKDGDIQWCLLGLLS